MSIYGVFSGPHFPVYSPNTRKNGPEKTPYLDTFHALKKKTLSNWEQLVEYSYFFFFEETTAMAVFRIQETKFKYTLLFYKQRNFFKAASVSVV